MAKALILAICATLSLAILSAQDRTIDTGTVAKKYLSVLSTTAEKKSQQLDRHTRKALNKFKKLESGLIKKLSKGDSMLQKEWQTLSESRYKELQAKLNNTGPGKYLSELDSLHSSLKFLETNPQYLKQAEQTRGRIQEALRKTESLKNGFSRAELVKEYLKQRREEWRSRLEQPGLGREFKQLNKQVYYYAARLREYKEALKDPKKAVKKGLELLAQSEKFREFWRKNSQLASLFRLPGDDASIASMASLAGLQTRAQVNSLIQQQLSAAGPNAQAQLQRSMQDAQNQLSQLKDKVMKYGGGSSDAEMPEGFKPNTQKSRTFLQRLELGTNIQSTRSNGILPTTTDLALSAGYRLNDKSIIGIGVNYKLGWGRNIQHIRLSHQGLGARSFIDWKLKGALWISGGFEMNYRSEIRNITELKDYSAWQQSGLIGLSRKIPIKTKFFKNTKLMLLWDFLSYRQVPRGQSLVMRIGYNF